MVDVDTRSGDNEVHEHVILDGPAGRLRNLMDHFAYPSIEVFVEKHNRYSNWEAALRGRVADSLKDSGQAGGIGTVHNARRLLKRAGRVLPFPHWLRFFYHFFLKFGFLDGLPGYVFCHLLAEYEFWIWAKGKESLSACSSGLPAPSVSDRVLHQ
jgi:hypothetical protein